MQLQDVKGGLCVDDVLSSSECAALTAAATEAGFRDKSGNVMFAGNRERSTFMHTELADRIWTRIRHLVSPFTFDAGVEQYHSSCRYSPPSGRYVPVGINTFMRVSLYGVGGDFRWHTDTVHSDCPERVGFQTLLLYLNDDVSGGETELLSPDDGNHSVTPRTGRVLVFDHAHVHQGCRVAAGVKYVLRTEIMFRKVSL
jgi:hypothetical protein